MRIPPTTRSTAAAAALVLAGISTALAPAAHAASPVGPFHEDVFVVDGTCDFPVQWDARTRDLGIDTSHQFISLTPGWSVTLTNLDTGATWSPHGDGRIAFSDLPNGNTLQTMDGVNYAPFLGLQLVGHWTRVLTPDGPTAFVGHGTQVDICSMLS